MAYSASSELVLLSYGCFPGTPCGRIVKSITLVQVKLVAVPLSSVPAVFMMRVPASVPVAVFFVNTGLQWGRSATGWGQICFTIPVFGASWGVFFAWDRSNEV